MPWAGRRSIWWAIPAAGAAALAFAAKRPDRLLSLALLEPAWAGNWDWSPAHAEVQKKYGELETLPPEQFLPAFARLGVKPDVVIPPPPPGPPPPWMANRPAGIKAFLRTFKAMTWRGNGWRLSARLCSSPSAA